MGNEQTTGLAEPVEGAGVVEKSGGEAIRPRPRVQAIDRQQGWLRSVVVEELVGGGPTGTLHLGTDGAGGFEPLL